MRDVRKESREILDMLRLVRERREGEILAIDGGRHHKIEFCSKAIITL